MGDQSADIARYLMYSDVAQGIWDFILLGICAGVLFGVWKLTIILAKVEKALDPLAGKAQDALVKVDQTLTNLEGKAESMLKVSEETVRKVASKVDTTSSLVEGAVAKPAISVRSVMAGINRGLETWRRFEPAEHSNGSADGTTLTEAVRTEGARTEVAPIQEAE